MRRPKELLGALANKVEKKALKTWANRVKEPKRVNSNLVPKQKFTESVKNGIKIENAKFIDD